MTHWAPIMNNPVFGGGVLLMLSGAVLALLRKVPTQIYEWVRDQVTVTVRVSSFDPCFEWITIWLNDHPYTKKARRLSASTCPSPANADDLQIIFSPSPGTHFIRYKGHLIWLIRERKDDTNGTKFQDPSFGPQKEEYWLVMLGRDQATIRGLLEDVRAFVLKKQEQGASAFIHRHYYWAKLDGFQPRPLGSVILPGSMVAEILADIKEFLAARQWYHERGVPYRRGYMFSGTPGSGKTSFIMGLSDELKMDIYVLNLGSRMVSDDSLPSLMLNIPPKSIILMEDIDAVVPDRERTLVHTNTPTTQAATPMTPAQTSSDATESADVPEKKTEAPKGVSLSCLLNCLDGVVAGNGSIVFMTSNHPERLDPALTRPGRVDVKREFGYVQPEQGVKLLQNFYPGVSSGLQENLADAVTRMRITMADLQRIFLEHKFAPELSVAKIEALADKAGDELAVNVG